MKVLEDKDGGLDQLNDLIQGVNRIPGGGVASFLRLNRRAGRHHPHAAGPFEDLFLALASDLKHELLNAHLLVRNDVEDGVTRADQGLELRLEVHGTSGTSHSLPKKPSPPGARRRSDRISRCLKPFSNRRWNRSVQSIMAEHLLD